MATSLVASAGEQPKFGESLKVRVAFGVSILNLCSVTFFALLIKIFGFGSFATFELKRHSCAFLGDDLVAVLGKVQSQKTEQVIPRQPLRRVVADRCVHK